MKITGQAQHTKETNQEAFMKGGDFLEQENSQLKLKMLNLMTKKEDISLSYLKITKVNNTNTINLYHHSNKTSKKDNISNC